MGKDHSTPDEGAISAAPLAPGLSGKKLARAISNSDHPEQFIRTVPAQSLYLAVKELGLTSAIDLIELATLEQCRTMIDFDCWEKDVFKEEQFWEWLSLTDHGESLELLQKLLKVFDLKLIALLIGRYVDSYAAEEPTDSPPGPSYYTPDKGRTWIYIKLEDSTKHFLLARLLALLFETNGDLFYQLLSIPGVATQTNLEEEGYQEKLKRLSAEGIPDDELAFSICSPLDQKSYQVALTAERTSGPVRDIPIVEPLIYNPKRLEPLSSLLREATNREELEGELTLIMNAAIVKWSTDIGSPEAIERLLEQVRGAINIGLELGIQYSKKSAKELGEHVGLQQIFRAGLGRLQELRQLAKSIPVEKLRECAESSPQFSIVAHARDVFAKLPAFYSDNNALIEDDGKLLSGSKVFEHLETVQSVENYLRQEFKLG